MTQAVQPPPAIEVAGQLPALRAERLRLYERNVRLAAAGQWLGALLLAAVLWQAVAPARLLGWLAVLSLVLGLRLLLWWRHRLRGADDRVAERLALIRTLAIGCGGVWGAAGVLLFPANEPQLQTFLVLVLTGIAAGSLTLFAFDLKVALVYSTAALLPLGTRLMANGDPAALGTGAMVVLFVGYLVVIGVRNQQALNDAVRTRAADAARADALLRSQQQLQELSAQLARKSAALELTLDSMDQGILSLGADGRTNVFNRRLSELIELPADWLAQAPTMAEIAAYQLEHGHYGDKLGHIVDDHARATLARWIAGERSQFPASYLRRTRTGAMLEVKTRYLPDGGLVRTFTDVTDYVEAQAQTRKLALVAAHTDDGVAITDAERHIEWINAGFTRITGLTLAQIAGRRLRDVLAGPAIAADELARQDEELARKGRTGGELQLLRSDGQSCWVEVEIQSILDADGGILQFVLMGRDVTARRETEAALRQARDEAERASRAKSEFLSSMSHELRTPMNAILGFAQLLDSDPLQPLPARQRAHVQQILRAGSHLLDLINDVLDLARVEAGKQPTVIEAVLLQPLIDECLALMRPAAQALGLQLRAEQDCTGGCVRADRMRLKQVLLNLLSNAVKYNQPGGSVQVQVEAVDEGFAIAIRDTGPGLAAEQQERLFNAFERLGAEGGPVEGAGIGLALSRRMVELMHGRIGLHSQVGQGSTFRVWLPAAPAPAVPNPAAPPAGSAAAGPDAPAGRCTVLYIEDNPVNVVLMEAMLQREPGVHLLTAQLPEVGIELALRERPDLVLLDIQLPGMDGYEVLRRLREAAATRRTPVVALTANAMPQDLARGRAAGFDDYLTKPVMLPDLLAVVRRALRG
ncbi:MAG: PAS-domain containing protein [Rubrivivax sp.]|nr:PAS-domain containing protein [Rubrivivax sp.]